MGDTATDSTTFKIIVKNPCVDTDFVEITSPTNGFDELDFDFGVDSEKSYTHPNFLLSRKNGILVSTYPSICGGMSCKATYDDIDVPVTDGDPMNYD